MLKIVENLLTVGAPPRTPLWELAAPPDSVSGGEEFAASPQEPALGLQPVGLGPQ